MEKTDNSKKIEQNGFFNSKDSVSEIKELSCLYEITKALSVTMELRPALQQVMKILAQNLGMTRGTVTIINPSTSELQIEVAHGLTAEARKRGRYKLGEGITGQVVATGEPIVIPRISQDPRFLNRTRSRGDTSKKDVSFICVPIKAGGQIIGALSVDRFFSKDISFEDDLRLLSIIAGLLAQSVERLQAIQREREALMDENLKLRLALSKKYEIDNLIGKSSRMQEVMELVCRVADSNATVLLRGESGTGKSMVAKMVHFRSLRKDQPFVTVNCSALPDTLIESELFGHEKGAFTGAVTSKKGRFEIAGEGTIFLDEIGDLPHAVQVKLLHVIQEREIQRLGGTKTIKCNARVIAATNKNLEEAMENGQFREDLYYRLNVFPIYIPPLRERKTDIILLAEHFLEKSCVENKKNIKRISTPAIDMLMMYHWPGNVRELQNAMERAALVCDGDVLRAQHLPPSLQMPEKGAPHDKKNLSLEDAVSSLEKEIIIEALKESKGNMTKAAKILDTSLRIIIYKIKKYGIEASLFKAL